MRTYDLASLSPSDVVDETVRQKINTNFEKVAHNLALLTTKRNIIDECFDIVYPLGTIYTSSQKIPPSLGEWRLVQDGPDYYWYERIE